MMQLRKLAREIAKREGKLEEESVELASLKKRLEKARQNCQHNKMERQRDGIVICQTCHQVLGYPPGYFGDEDDGTEADGQEGESAGVVPPGGSIVAPGGYGGRDVF
jgi:ribosomal protein L37AE/L43A